MTWKATTETIASIPCLKHSLNKELCAFGEQGQLYEFGTGEFRAMVYRKDGSEDVHVVPPTKLRHWVEKLDIPTSIASQLRLANPLISGLPEVAKKPQNHREN